MAIVVVGERQHMTNGEDTHGRPTDGEGHDVASLDLSGVQEDLIQAVFATGTPTVVVLINGRPLSTRWTSDHVPALVEAWEPGERGGEAVAAVDEQHAERPGPERRRRSAIGYERNTNMF